MPRIIYLLILISGVLTVVATPIMFHDIINSADWSKAGDKFEGEPAAAVLGSLTVAGLGIMLATILGLAGILFNFIFNEKLPKTLLYKIWWPIMLATPGMIIAGFLAYSSFV